MEDCNVVDCDLPPIYKCTCAEPKKIFCDLHATEHIKLDGSHVLLANYIGLTPWRIALSMQCTNYIKKYRIAKNKVMQVLRDHIQKLSQMTLKFIEEITVMEVLYFEASDFMRTNDKIINKPKFTPVEEFILKYLEKPNEVGSHFLQDEAELMKEIDLKTRLDESNEKVFALSEEVKKRVKEINELKEKFEKANNLREKNFNQIRSGLERTIKVKTNELKISKEESSREINKINQSFEQTAKLNEKHMKEIIEMNTIIQETKNALKQKEQEVLSIQKHKSQEISAINKRLVEIKAVKKIKNKQITEVQKKIKELQIVNSQKSTEVNEITKKLKEMQEINQNYYKTYLASIEQKNVEISQMKAKFDSDRLAFEHTDKENRLIIQGNNEELIQSKKKSEERYKLHQESEKRYLSLIEEKNNQINALDKKLKQFISDSERKNAENRKDIIEWTKKLNDANKRFEESQQIYMEDCKKYQAAIDEKNKHINCLTENLKENANIFEQKNEENERLINECRKQFYEISERFEKNLEASFNSEKKNTKIIEEKNAEVKEINKRYEEVLKIFESKNTEYKIIIEENNKIFEHKNTEYKIIIEEHNKKLIATINQLEEALKANELKDKELANIGEHKSKIIRELIRLEFKNTIEERNVFSIRPEMEHKIVKNIRIEHESKFLCYFENNSKNFCVIDVITGKDTRTAIDIPDYLSMHTGFCELPDEKWFCYSSSAGNCSGACYIFDIKMKMGTKLIDHLPKRHIGSCCYLNNCVYSFGGNMNENSCTNSEKFDLSLHKWQEIQPMPIACTSISTVNSKDMIIISALQLKSIIEYDTIANTYKTYLNGSFSIYHAVLSIGYGNIYLLKSGSLWNITDYQKNILTHINKSTRIPNFRLVSGPIRNGWKIFFLLENKQIWRFDLLSKEIINIRDLEDY